MCKPHNRTHSARRQPEHTAPRPEQGAERVGDRDRDEMASALRAAATEGRLEIQELEDRLAATYAAKTRDDLAGVTAGLERWLARTETPRRVPRHSLGVYALVMLILISIWILTGAGYFWPMWPALGWGLPLVMRRRAGMPHSAEI